MNKQRRREIDKIIQQLTDASSRLENVKDQEEEALDNTPENLQDSDRYNEGADCVSKMEDAKSDLDNVIQSLEEI